MARRFRIINTMKRFLLISFLALICAGPLFPTTSEAVGINIELGDRPYYNHGPWYYGPHRERLYWVPGHWARRHHHRVWIHGHYVRR